MRRRSSVKRTRLKQVFLDFVKNPTHLGHRAEVLKWCNRPTLIVEGEYTHSYSFIELGSEDNPLIKRLYLHCSTKGKVFEVTPSEVLAGIHLTSYPDLVSLEQDIKKREKFLSSVDSMLKCMKSQYDTNSVKELCRLDNRAPWLVEVMRQCRSDLFERYVYKSLVEGIEIAPDPNVLSKLIGFYERAL